MAGLLGRVLKTMVGHMLANIKDGHADAAAHFAVLAAKAAFAFNPKLAAS